jgi:peptide/nickel transport system ATP-binding protein
MPEPVLRINGLSVGLPGGGDRTHAVADLSLDLRPGEILCVVGESGSGKSVTALSTMGLLPPRLRVTGGEILFEGENILRVSAIRMRQIRGQRISMIFQDPMTALNPLMTIGEQIEEVMAAHGGVPRAERRRRAVSILADVRLPDPARIAHAYPHELSGGQRQRAMIAMALVLEPAILIADEPTTALDVTTQAQILKLIKELQAEHGTGVLFITHDFGIVAEIADRVAVMQKGRLVEFGEADRVLNRPEHPYTRSLVAAVPTLTPKRRAREGAAAPLLAVEGLDKSFSSGGGLFGRSARVVRAVREVNFTIRRGETLGIVGESGSGKSTVARCVVRLLEADTGRIVLDGTDLRSLAGDEMRRFRKRIQMIFQDPFASLNPRLKVGRLIAQGPMIHGADLDESLDRAYRLLDLVGLDRRAADRFPHEFSGGQRQRIGIARALALEPEVLIADEPVSSLDVSVQDQVLRLLADIRERLRLTMLFITHDLRVAAQVADSVAVMHQGRIVEYGRVEDIFGSPRHPYTRELMNAVPGKDWTIPVVGGNAPAPNG